MTKTNEGQGPINKLNNIIKSNRYKLALRELEKLERKTLNTIQWEWLTEGGTAKARLTDWHIITLTAHSGELAFFVGNTADTGEIIATGPVLFFGPDDSTAAIWDGQYYELGKASSKELQDEHVTAFCQMLRKWGWDEDLEVFSD